MEYAAAGPGQGLLAGIEGNTLQGDRIGFLALATVKEIVRGCGHDGSFASKAIVVAGRRVLERQHHEGALAVFTGKTARDCLDRFGEALALDFAGVADRVEHDAFGAHAIERMEEDSIAWLAPEPALLEQLLQESAGGLVHEFCALGQAVVLEEWNGKAVASVREDIPVADVDFHTDLCAGSNIC